MIRLILATAALLLSAQTVAGQQVSDSLVTVDSTAVPALPAEAVVVGRDTLFTISTRLGPYSAAERRDAVETRIRTLIDDPLGRFDAVEVVDGEQSTDIVIGGVIVTTVTEADALALGVTREALAAQRAEAIQVALQEESFGVQLRVILLGILLSLIVAVATYFTFRFVNRIFPRIFEILESGRGSWIPSIRIQKVELFSADSLTNVLIGIARVVRILVIVLVLYISVPIILSFFPWTRRYADQLFGYVLTPFAAVGAAFISSVPDLFSIAAIIVVTLYVLKLIRPIFAGLARQSITLHGFYPEWSIPTYQIVRVLVILFAVVAIWPYVPGSDSPAFQGVGVFVGLLISLGSAAAISNLMGGVVITYMRPFKLGDRVKIADTVGDVVEKTLLVTRIRTPKNVDITVPNAMILASHIVNYSSSAKDPGLILHTTVTIGYDVPWRQVHGLLLGAAAKVEEVVAEPAPFVLQTSLDDFYVSYELNAYTDRPRYMTATYSALHEAIQDAFRDANVEIMSPHYRANRDGPTTVPGE